MMMSELIDAYERAAEALARSDRGRPFTLAESRLRNDLARARDAELRRLEDAIGRFGPCLHRGKVYAIALRCHEDHLEVIEDVRRAEPVPVPVPGPDPA